MREAGARLLARDRSGRDVFMRPDPEGLHTIRKVAWKATIFDLISSYGQIRARARPDKHIVARRPVMTLEEALERVGRLVGVSMDWTVLESFLPDGTNPALRESALASSLAAAHDLDRPDWVNIRTTGFFE